MAHFFLAGSHNNLCLSLAVIVQEELKDSHIIYLKRSNQDKEFLYFFRNQMQEMGITVSFPCERPVRSKRDAKDDKVYGRRIKSVIKKLKKKKEPGSYYFFDDRTVESQYISSKVMKKADKAFLVQDEMNFFVPSAQKKTSAVMHFFKKLKYGFFLKDLVQVGQLRKYDGLFCLKPEAMLESYKQLTRVNLIQAKALFNTYLRNISASLFNEKFEEFFDLTERETLIFLPKIINAEEITGIRVELLHKFAGQKYPHKFFIKNHSEGKIIIKEQDIGHGLKFVPNGIPDECFFVFGEERSFNYYMAPSISLLLIKLNKSAAKVSLIGASRDAEYGDGIREFMKVMV
ncbi:MAG: hypothetical protein M9899_05910 [Bdellovibrionaceae bacterium]|nr:hypothetical protein [Pseudobdellovibrionaceae bacterium]